MQYIAAHRFLAEQLPDLTPTTPCCPHLVCTRFWAGVRSGGSDINTGITITDNTFEGGWDTILTYVPVGVHAIALSAAASTAGQDKRWSIQNNDISGVNIGFEWRGPTGTAISSMAGVVINTNSIVADYQCSADVPVINCYVVKNGANIATNMPNSW